MSKEKRRVPKLRFPGFTEDWEQRKLGDLTPLRGGFAFKSTEFKATGVPVIRISNILSDSSIGGDFAYYLEQNNDENYVLPNNALVIAMSGATTGKAAVLKNTGNIKFYQNQRVGYFQNNLKCDYSFISTLVKSSIFLKQLESVLVAGAQPNISSKEIDSFIFKIPISTDEQRKISKLFNMIDSTITLHQRKLEHLNLKKKALLQKLFPKNGERYPELRFPGFTDAWEQRKADYIFKSVTDKGYPELPVLSASQELGMVYREQNGIDIQHDKKNEASYKRVLPGQFVIHLRSFQGGFAYSEIEGITSPAYTVMSFKNSNEQYGLFWKHIFKSETFIKRLETITYGIRDGRSISFSDFKSLILQYPSFSEQKMIGDSIAIIEIGITLHQRKLDHLQLQKKALLQQMFV